MSPCEHPKHRLEPFLLHNTTGTAELVPESLLAVARRNLEASEAQRHQLLRDMERQRAHRVGAFAWQERVSMEAVLKTS